MKKQYIFLIIISQICNYVSLAEIDYLQIVFMNDINDIFVIDYCNVSFKVEEIFAIIAESVLYLLKFSILFGINKLEEVLFLIHNDL
jgi:hypothetical protein